MYAILETLFRNHAIFFLFLAGSISYPLLKKKKEAKKPNSGLSFKLLKSENQNWSLEMNKQMGLLLEQGELP